jgi:HSP20 family protein
MSTLTFYHPLEMMDRLLNNTTPIVQSKKYFVDEKEDNFILEIPVPGFQQDDISVEIENDLLVITGENTESYWTEDFVKKFKLPNTVDQDSIEGKISDGILTIKLLKKKESLPKKIKIS